MFSLPVQLMYKGSLNDFGLLRSCGSTRRMILRMARFSSHHHTCRRSAVCMMIIMTVIVIGIGIGIGIVVVVVGGRSSPMF